MSEGVFLAWSSPVSAAEDEAFNAWYEDVHMPQVRAAIPAITGVRRFTVLGSEEGGGVRRYVACYELADADVAEVAAALAKAGASGAFDMSPVMDLSKTPPDLQFLVPVDRRA
jgi:hypothetical protein